MKESSNIKCITFDMDGCLVDTEAAYIRSWKKAFITEGFPIDDSVINSWAGGGFTYINSEIDKLTQNHEKTMKIRERREDFFFEALEAGEVDLKPFTREILDFIKGKKLKIGLGSSTYREKATRVLDHYKLLDYFDLMVFGDEVDNLKPASDIYDEVIKRSEENASDIIVFEDSVSGVTAAKAAGIKKIIHVPDSSVKNSQVYLNTFARVNDFSEGIDIIKKYLR